MERVRAYNGVASMLVTEAGTEIPEACGTVRAMAPVRFPIKTVTAVRPHCCLISKNTKDRRSSSVGWRQLPLILPYSNSSG